MADSLLQIIQDVADEVGITAPSFVIGNTDQNARRMLAHANNAGRDIAKAHSWADLVVSHNITTVAAQTTYDLPIDFDRLIPETAWSNQERLRGSLTPRELQFRRQMGTPIVVDGYRLKISSGTSTITIDPAPANSGDDIDLFYISKNWAANGNSGLGQNRFSTDSDTLIIDEDLVRMGTVWRVKSGLGLPFAEEKLEFEDRLKSAIIDDLSLPWMRMTRHHTFNEPPPTPRVPEGSWGV